MYIKIRTKIDHFQKKIFISLNILKNKVQNKPFKWKMVRVWKNNQMNLSNLIFMNKSIRLFVFFFSCALCLNLSAQDVTTFTVRGLLTDSIERQPLDAANVMIVRARDSVLVTGGMSDNRGIFELGKISAGQYLLIVSYLGYNDVKRPLTLSGTPRTVNLGGIVMQKKDLQIGEVMITGKFNPIVVKKDTIEFNTSAYKILDTDVVEDLLKKLPGVEVESDGTVTAGGQQVTKVFVDGKQFFGDDPKVAMRNLPANIVDKVQVVDRRSDQAQFTGIEDDDTEKVINLTLRPGNRDGIFGRAMAGYGTDDRYDANGMISYFSGETQLAALLSSNNTNNLNFTDFMGDVMSGMGGGGMRQGGGGGGGGPVIMMVNTGGGGGGRIGSGGGGMRNLNIGGFSMSSGGGGISTSTSGGLNANYRFNEKLKLNSSYFFNVVDRVADQTSNRINFVGDSSLYYNQWQWQDRMSQNHRINLELDYTINERNSILFRPNLNIGSGSSNSEYNYNTYTPSDFLLNSGETYSSAENTSLSTSGSMLWRHKFEKTGRTFSMNMSYGVSSNKSNGDNNQTNLSYDPLTGAETSRPLFQDYTNDNNGYNYSVRTSYVEPLGNKRFLELSYSYSQNNTKSEKETWNLDSNGNRIDKDEQYSTIYENKYVNQQADIRFNTQRDKYSYTLGAGLQPSSLKSLTNGETLTQNVVNFSPTVNITYGETRQSQLRFDYRGMTRQPTIQQLQPVADNSDPLYEFKGNKSLKPAFMHNLMLMYNKFNPTSLRTFQTSLVFNTTRNSIINSSNYDETGKQTVMPDNVNGVYNIRASVNTNMPIAKTKLSFNNNVSVNYGHNVNKTNGIENTTKNSGINETLRLTFRNDWLELGGSYRLGYNRAVYTMQDKATTDYFNHRVGGNLYLNLPLNFILTSNLNYDFYRGDAAGEGRDLILWTADLSKQVFKNKRGTIKISVYDILKQNKSYSRTTTDNYIEDLRSNTLGQFAMISFMYRFNSFSGSSQQNIQRGDSMPRGSDGPVIRRFEGGGAPIEGGGGIFIQRRD